MAREPNEVKARCFQDSVGQRGKLQNNTKGGTAYTWSAIFKNIIICILFAL